MMATVESNLEEEKMGKLVALEGNTENISVQLRLLPPSRKILVLPPVDHKYFTQSSDEFDARAFIRGVHEAFTKRTEAARSFLQLSTSTHPKLVFFNGGAINARAICIAKISENITNGIIGAAETVFNEIVKDGVDGLMKGCESDDKRELSRPLKAEEEREEEKADISVRETKMGENSFEQQNEIFRSKDLEDISLQPLDDDNQDPIKNRTSGQRSDRDPGTLESWQSHSLKQLPDERRAIVTTQQDDQIVQTVLEIPARNRRLPTRDPKAVQEKRSTFGPCDSNYTGTTQFTTALAHRSEESEDDGGYDGISPSDMISMPATPAVVFGEACLVDVQSRSPSRTIRRAQSFDRFSPGNSRIQTPTLAPPQLKHTTSAYHLRGRARSPKGQTHNRYSTFSQSLPRTTFVKASETTIKRSPTLNGSTRTASPSGEAHVPCLYVDQATDGEVFEVSKVKAFSPVFPLVEDLVIHFIDDSPNEILGSVLKSYKCGDCSIDPSSQAVPTTISDSRTSEYSSIRPTSFDRKQGNRPESYQSILQGGINYTVRNEFDPYGAAPYPAYRDQRWPGTSHYKEVDNTQTELLEPIQTPANRKNSNREKFVDFSPVSSSNAISIQDSLRQLLSRHFPAGENQYSQHCFPVAPEADRLWKPVFRNDENASFGNEGPTVDQIIALGCEAGVKREFFHQISGQVERLGTKKDGLNRSGKLDIRYLIANAIQAYSMTPLIVQATFNPFSDPGTLAASLVPQIEAFLASNPSTRLLILHYQPTHLPIILALRRILGTDLFKIAGVLDSLASDPPSFARHRDKLSNPLSNDSIAERWRGHAKHAGLYSLQRPNTALDLDAQVQTTSASNSSILEPITFSRANYLLPSTATDTEITTFLSSIWKALMEKSTFYTPEPEIKPVMIIERPALPPTPTSAVHSPYESRARDFERGNNYASSTYRGTSSKISRITGNAIPDSPRLHARSARSHFTNHRSSSRTSTKSHRERELERARESAFVSLPQARKNPPSPNKGERRITLGLGIGSGDKTKDGKEGDWENFYIGEDDSDDDEFDRMIMGRQMARIVPEVMGKGGLGGASLDGGEGGMQAPRNKKKALKWLGLA